MPLLNTVNLVTDKTTTGAASTKDASTLGPHRVYAARGTTSAGAGAATILIQGSLDGTNWITLATITLTLATTSSADGFASTAPWPYIRANVSAISGTGAAVTVDAGA